MKVLLRCPGRRSRPGPGTGGTRAWSVKTGAIRSASRSSPTGKFETPRCRIRLSSRRPDPARRASRRAGSPGSASAAAAGTSWSTCRLRREVLGRAAEVRRARCKLLAPDLRRRGRTSLAAGDSVGRGQRAPDVLLVAVARARCRRADTRSPAHPRPPPGSSRPSICHVPKPSLGTVRALDLEGTSDASIVCHLQPVPTHPLASLGVPGRLAQLGERRLDKAEVAGSSPVSPTSETALWRGFGASDAPRGSNEVAIVGAAGLDRALGRLVGVTLRRSAGLRC